MVQVLDWVQGLVQERVLALARAQGGASRQGLWAWTSTFLSLPVGRVILRLLARSVLAESLSSLSHPEYRNRGRED